MSMNHMVMGIPKPPLPEIRSFLTEKKKVPIGWSVCLKRSPPKATFNNNDIYMKSTESSENLYEEPHERETEEDQGPSKENIRVFFINKPSMKILILHLLLMKRSMTSKIMNT